MFPTRFILCAGCPVGSCPSPQMHEHVTAHTCDCHIFSALLSLPRG